MIEWILDTDILTLYERDHPVVVQNCTAHPRRVPPPPPRQESRCRVHGSCAAFEHFTEQVVVRSQGLQDRA